MRLLNIVLMVLIAGILIFPGAVVAKVADACCGVDVSDLVVDVAPDPACLGDTVNISGTYNTFSPWGEWTDPWNSGVDIRIFDSASTLVDEFNLMLAENQPDPGDYPGTPLNFSQDWTPAAAETYSVTVVAWSATQWGRMEVSIVGQPLPVEVCNEPPDCSNAAPSVSMIWPPNHKFVPVTIDGVTDPDGDPVTITITSIMQDEPVDWAWHTPGDGNFAPDGKGVGTDTAEVRAERSGSKKAPGDGRVYHIGFTASDGKGGTCSGTVTVGVPHDKKDTPVDGGALFNSVIP
ncbi:hypothetical protein ACFLRP_03545 [Bacteroidota bacterium]